MQDECAGATDTPCERETAAPKVSSAPPEWLLCFAISVDRLRWVGSSCAPGDGRRRRRAGQQRKVVRLSRSWLLGGHGRLRAPRLTHPTAVPTPGRCPRSARLRRARQQQPSTVATARAGLWSKAHRRRTARGMRRKSWRHPSWSPAARAPWGGWWSLPLARQPGWCLTWAGRGWTSWPRWRAGICGPRASTGRSCGPAARQGQPRVPGGRQPGPGPGGGPADLGELPGRADQPAESQRLRPDIDHPRRNAARPHRSACFRARGEARAIDGFHELVGPGFRDRSRSCGWPGRATSPFCDSLAWAHQPGGCGDDRAGASVDDGRAGPVGCHSRALG